ncbi:hypothetical protein MJO28_000038 [Puccinia striiformis f. sp. tritici]|uniref:Tc1-like transposase DDE domain-containing protein n=3 Tax=Puccinia striiformis f. sp. tritici TaxID=168172 RepID=A0A0L0V574_9BASI|nr:hypothetical protein MJO28_010681 [Puccinia striiformis f. sp. tritici]KAI7961944.1 hypothetical protein MJO28_000038 [Puccinia striiformis f. sp. tritici]KAI7967913.1 hypothetical protein MJO29_001190 [Puccinia striiformis f. sp. tritici]KNE94423.1 hypothetical protein PSTG_12218 [Puccinia striiformis f. sp. tritici PST-78]
MVFVKYHREVKVIAVKLSQEGVPLAEINATIGKSISPDSMARWNELYIRTRDVVRDPELYANRGRPLAFTQEEAEFVLIALDAEPTLYLDEIQAHIVAMTGTSHPLATIADELRVRLHLTKKTARTVHPAQSDWQRAEFRARTGPIPSSHLVFLDECGVSLGTHSRDKAWARKGRRTDRIPRALGAPRISVLPAVCLDGMLAVMAQEGIMVRLDIEYFLEEVLMPQMNPFPGRNSVLVLDNAPIHHGGRIAEICEAARVLLVYLPPYSPDLNPIEKVFSVLKNQLKRHRILTGTGADADIITEFLGTFISPRLMAGLFRGSGYPA